MADKRPILLVEQEGQKRIVAACCERAHKAGVRRGMPAGQARAAFPGDAVRLEPATPERDLAVLRALAVWAHQFSPIVALDEPDGLMLDVTGCERVFKGEARLLALVRERFAARGFTVRAAIAPSFGCAWAVARFGREPDAIVPEGGEREALRSLPVRALRIEAEAEYALGEVGITRVGELFDLPRSVLPVRFGPGLLFRLDQALGRAIETVEPVRPIAPPRVERCFAGPSTDLGAIGWCIRELLAELSAELLTRESGARRIDLTLDRSDLEPAQLAISMSRPNRDARHLWSLFEPRLARTHLGFGVERIEMVASRTARIRHEQGTHAGAGEHWGSAADTPEAALAIAELADTLTNRFGRDRVVQAELAPSHLPERAERWRPAEVDRKPAAIEKAIERALQEAAELAPAPPPDRPTLLLPRPEPAEVVAITPDGPVARLCWRGVDHPVVACIGPERISPEWWRFLHPTRDYFRIQDAQGRWLWVFREMETGRWFVQGVW
ncbi:MAG: DNA polymerase Y family protein [Phycisphaerales bacterium]|nr:DNA polymerase Y family protein [Phycisphaerales bacterium]